MPHNTRSIRRSLLGATALAGAISMMAVSPAAAADGPAYEFSQPAQPLAQALRSYSATADQEIIFADRLVAGRTAPELKGAYTAQGALMALLDGTGLTVTRTSTGVLLLQAEQDPQGGSAAGRGASTVEALIVTAQKREEDIQDVPIAISAFSQEDLTRSQVAGGPDLFTQVPNMTFTKTNFTGYSIQIRGIGTQAISATTDPAVAVAMNNTPFIRNRFFEQEFYDLQRVEVLRGPQGTLYGRNATAGVVNIITAKPKFFFEAKASADVANYNSSRIEGMVNIPLVEDAVALRLAGAWTKRDGYAFNDITGGPIDGRDLWSTRLSLRMAPSGAPFDATLIWEHFEEDDDRIRSGKQLCKKHTPTDLGGFPFNNDSSFPGPQQFNIFGPMAQFSQGCERSSLYSPDVFQTPNSRSLPYYGPLSFLGPPVPQVNGGPIDPYVSQVQSRDLRVIESTVDPRYKASADLGELQISWDLSDTLTLVSETAYSADRVWSTQDFNRFNTASGAWDQAAYDAQLLQGNRRAGILKDGFFCDPQIGCADRLVAVDLSTGDSRQFSQEFRLSSQWDGRFNFNLGTNFLRFDGEDKYYVFINSIGLYSAIRAFGVGISDDPAFDWDPNGTDNREFLNNGLLTGDPGGVHLLDAPYIDPNPIESVNDQGHNYFLSKNPYKLISYAVFGEAYYNVTDNLKVTAGLRWSVDKKEAPRIPSWTLAGGTVGYPVLEVVEQEWREPTGRLVVDWKPDLSFTDETLLYASYAHGYKAGGANPPPYVPALLGDSQEGFNPREVNVSRSDALRPKVFEPEFVDAFELGAKNTFLDGRVTFNLAAFYYDYEGYQVSEIVDRSAYNRNFDTEVWGAEIESDWRPAENLRFGLKVGYQKTRIADGEEAIDLMDRTAGREGWTIVRPYPAYPSSCILPESLFIRPGGGGLQLQHVGNYSGGGLGGCEYAYFFGLDPLTRLPYVANPTVGRPGNQMYPGYPGFDPFDPEINVGEGFAKQLGGNELPNAPNWTATITGDYTVPLTGDWLMNLHTDLHWQAESYWRVFQDHDYSTLDEYFTMNLAAIFTNEDQGWNIMAYVKNVTDETAITGAFLFSDDTGLVTNVFLTEPRLYGLRVTKTWTGGPLLGSFGERHAGPYPFTVEVGGQVQRHDAPNATIMPSFLDQFSPEIDPTGDQDFDLDWGDGREVKVAYRATSGWKASLAARFGKTNGSRPFTDRRELGAKACGQALSACEYAAQYRPSGVGGPSGSQDGYIFRYNYTNSSIASREEHTLVDFVVGKDVGMGLFDTISSSVSAGVRYAQLESAARLDIFGNTNHYFPVEENLTKYQNLLVSHDHYELHADIDRRFEGVGPILNWEASRTLLGGHDNGALALDWSLSGGVLFGKRETTLEGEELAEYFQYPTSVLGQLLKQPTPDVSTPTDIGFSRSEDVEVPMLGATLGVSYSIDRFRVGAGYRWERYYDAIDVGYDEAKDGDRTIDGPYLKISVGFGGG